MGRTWEPAALCDEWRLPRYGVAGWGSLASARVHAQDSDTLDRLGGGSASLPSNRK